MVCYGCHPDYCICPQPEDEVALMGRRSPRPYSQTAYHGQQRTHFDPDQSPRPGRAFPDKVPVNHAPPSFNRHKPETPGNDRDPFAADFQNSTNPNQPSAAYDQRGRNPHLMYSFSSSNRTFNTHGTNHTGTTINYSGFQEEDGQRSRPPFRNSSTQRARSSSSDSFVYDVGFKSVQDAQRRAARRERDYDSRKTFGLPFGTKHGRTPFTHGLKKTSNIPLSDALRLPRGGGSRFAMVAHLVIVFAPLLAMTLSENNGYQWQIVK